MIVNKEKLTGINPVLIKWVLLLAPEMEKEGYTTIVTYGLRTIKEQEKLFKEGKTKTMNSKHLTGNAVDLAFSKGGKIDWKEKLPYQLASNHFKFFMKGKNKACRWGGDFKTLDDPYHYEIN